MFQPSNSQYRGTQEAITTGGASRNVRRAANDWRQTSRDMFALIGAFSVILVALNVLVPGATRSGASSTVIDHDMSGEAKQVRAPVTESFEKVAYLPERGAVKATAVEPHERALANYVARNFRIAFEPARALVASAYRAARGVNVDPLLLVAVMAIESRFNPIAESDMGAKGLMQIIPKFHMDKLDQHGGEQSVLEPEVNILVGAQILKEYIVRAGSVEAGLQWYNGAATDLTRQYADRVLAEYDRLAPLVGRASMPRSPKPVAAATTLGPVPDTPPTGLRSGEST